MADQQKLMPYHARIGLAIAFLVLRAPMAEAQAPCGPGYLVQSVACRADFTEYEANEIGFRIWLALPRARAGETVSSRIYVDIDAASGRKDDSREERAWLNTQRLKWGSNSTPIADNVVVWKVPSGLKEVPDSLTAHFMDRGFRLPVNEPSPPGMDLSGWWLYQLVNLGFTVPLESISGNHAVQRVEIATSDGEHFVSPVETTLAPIEIRGPFGGDENTWLPVVGQADDLGAIVERIANAAVPGAVQAPKIVEGATGEQHGKVGALPIEYRFPGRLARSVKPVALSAHARINRGEPVRITA
jgi:hypothetical protein